MVEMLTGRKMRKLGGHYGTVHCLSVHPHEQVSQSVSRLVSQSVSQSVSQPASQPVSQSAACLLLSQELYTGGSDANILCWTPPTPEHKACVESPRSRLSHSHLPPPRSLQNPSLARGQLGCTVIPGAAVMRRTDCQSAVCCCAGDKTWLHRSGEHSPLTSSSPHLFLLYCFIFHRKFFFNLLHDCGSFQNYNRVDFNSEAFHD